VGVVELGGGSLGRTKCKWLERRKQQWPMNTVEGLDLRKASEGVNSPLSKIGWVGSGYNRWALALYHKNAVVLQCEL
jgi:hypothetical protein